MQFPDPRVQAHLTMCGHVDSRLGRNGVFAPPQTCDCLLLCVELKSGLAVEGVGAAASNGLLVASEREHGKLQDFSQKTT